MLIVGAAGFDLLGPRTATTSANGGGYDLAVEFPQIARAGEPAPLNLTITSEDVYDQTVQVRFCGSYFKHLDFQSWYPNPSAETSDSAFEVSSGAAPDGDWVVYEFDAPPTGNTLRIALDARVAPGQLAGRDSCEVSVLEDDQPVVTATWTTWRMP
ncbi:hypothetical protein [Nocardioides flavus (ex Wang et al. 2016)]|nr:hypothetical protein [Nocardioides flavus (ex Wang et al. 2016)]